MSKNKDLEAPLKIALVHDWLTNMRGGERVLLAMKEAFPDADIYTSVYNSQNLPEFDKYKDQIKTTWIQKFPKKLRNFHQLFPVIRVFAFKSLNLKDYDIIISDTSSDAKHARGGPKTKHICYCFTGFGKLNLLIKPIIPPFVWLMRKFDYSAAQKVNQFVAISSEIQNRIKKYYNRDSTIIYPPADVEDVKFNSKTENRDGYVVLGAQVAYKRADLAIKACIKLNLNLTLVGDGSENARFRKLAYGHKSIKFKTDVADSEKLELLGRFKAQIFPQEEDYGITAIECMAAGTPVIAYKKGGALDFISNNSGIFFEKQTFKSLVKVLQEVESGEVKFKPTGVRSQAEKFNKEKFIKEIQTLVSNLKLP